MEWSRQDLDTLRTEAHLGAAHLSAKLGRSVNAIQQKASYLRISLRRRGHRRGLLLGQKLGSKIPRLEKNPVVRGIVDLSLASGELGRCACGGHYAVTADGMCLVCASRRKVDLYQEDVQEQIREARPHVREYNRRKKQAQRIREFREEERVRKIEERARRAADLAPEWWFG